MVLAAMLRRLGMDRLSNLARLSKSQPELPDDVIHLDSMARRRATNPQLEEHSAARTSWPEVG